jgi:hypothetical protein
MRALLLRFYFLELAIAAGVEHLLGAAFRIALPRPREVLTVCLVALSIFAPVMPAAAQQQGVSAGVGQIVQPFTDCSKPQYAGVTWDVTLANCISSMGNKTSAILNMCRANSGPSVSQTIAADPFYSLVSVSGFAPTQTGEVVVCAGNYTVNEDLVIPTGWKFHCLQPHFGGSSAEMGCNLLLNTAGMYNTGQITNTTAACSGGCGTTNPLISTVTASGAAAFTSGMRLMRIGSCTSLLTGVAGCNNGATAGAAAFEGLILSVNVPGQTMQVLVTSGAKGNGNATAVNYVIYPVGVQLGGNSSNSTSAGSNFGTWIGGFTVDAATNTVNGAGVLGNFSASNLSGCDGEMTLIPYNSFSYYNGGPSSQNSVPCGSEKPLWVEAMNNVTLNTAVGIVDRHTGSYPVPYRDASIALAGAWDGVSLTTGILSCGLCADSPVAWLGGEHEVLSNYSSNTTSVGIDLGDAAGCPIYCPDAPGNISGSVVIDLNDGSYGSTAVKIGGTTNTNIVVMSIKDINTPASGLPDLLSDPGNTGCVVPYNDTANANSTLGIFWIDASGKAHSSSSQPGCNTFVDAAANGGLGTSTAPSSAQLPLGNVGGTAYAPQTMTQDCTISNAGVITCTKTNNVAFSGLATAAVPLTVPNGGTGLTTCASTRLLTGAGTGAFNCLIQFTVSAGGLVATYNNVATAGIGLEATYFQSKNTALQANYNSGSAQTMITPSAASEYVVCYYEAITQAATSSSTAPSGTLGYTDAGGIARTLTLFASSAANATGTIVGQGCTPIYTNTSTAVTFTSASYASSGGTVMQYELMLSVSQK